LRSYLVALVTQVPGGTPVFYAFDDDLFFGFPVNDGDREGKGDICVFASSFDDLPPGNSAHYGHGVLSDVEGNGEEYGVAGFAVVFITTVDAGVAEAVEFALTVEGKDAVVLQGDGDRVNDAYTMGAEGLVEPAELLPAVDLDGRITANYADGVIDVKAWAGANIIVDITATTVEAA
jgi:hypothetical protein